MTLDEFKTIVDQKRKNNPFWFDDKPDRLASDKDIFGIEKKLGVKLPCGYKEFIKHFGGGYFALTNIFSADECSEWFIVTRNDKARAYLPNNFLAISDDQTGGYYGYVIQNNNCSECVSCWDHDGSSISKPIYEDIFEFVIKIGFN